MPGPAVTVAFPIYNGEPTMLDSLRCISRQSLADFRGLIVENGSTDRTVEIAEAFCREDTRFELVRNDTHLDAMSNFLKAIDLASQRSTYFCLRACDDFSTDDFLERLVGALEADPQKWMAVGNVERRGDGKVQLLKPGPTVPDFPRAIERGDIPRSLRFPSEWFYGVYRSDPAASVLRRRLPELGTAWCAASYTVAEFVIRGRLAYVDGPAYQFTLGSASPQLYQAKTIGGMLRERRAYARGCFAVLDHLGPVPVGTRLRLAKLFRSDARTKMRYWIRRTLRARIRDRMKSWLGRSGETA